MDEILQVHHISRSYMDKNHPFRAVEDVSFSLHAGEMLGIVGLSGSGKSTVLRMAGALEEPEKGNIQRPWARDKDFYRHIQMVFQDPLEAFSPRMTIHEFLLEPLLNFHMANREEAESRIRQMMKQTDIPEELLTNCPTRSAAASSSASSLPELSWSIRNSFSSTNPPAPWTW